MNREALFQRVADAIIDAPGKSSRGERAAAFHGEPTGSPIDAYLAQVRTRAHAITDEDVAALGEAGRDDDDIFELTVAAAFGESSRRRDLVLAALERVDET